MNLLEAQDWSFPVPITHGAGRLKEIATLCTQAKMTRPLLVTDRGEVARVMKFFVWLPELKAIVALLDPESPRL